MMNPAQQVHSEWNLQGIHVIHAPGGETGLADRLRQEGAGASGRVLERDAAYLHVNS